MKFKKIWKLIMRETHAKRIRLQNLHCAFQDARMMEDESVRSYNGRILEIVAGIRSHGGT